MKRFYLEMTRLSHTHIAHSTRSCNGNLFLSWKRFVNWNANWCPMRMIHPCNAMSCHATAVFLFMMGIFIFCCFRWKLNFFRTIIRRTKQQFEFFVFKLEKRGERISIVIVIFDPSHFVLLFHSWSRTKLHVSFTRSKLKWS